MAVVCLGRSAAGCSRCKSEQAWVATPYASFTLSAGFGFSMRDVNLTLNAGLVLQDAGLMLQDAGLSAFSHCWLKT